MTSLTTNKYFLIKLDRVSCTHYFMSILYLRYNVQLIIIAMGNKEIFEKMPRFWHFKQLCARHIYVCPYGLYAVYIVTQTPSLRRSRDLDKSNNFRQMQELTNDFYSVIVLHNIFHIAYRPLNLVLIKKNQQLHSGSQYWNDNEAATDHGGVMADSCIRRMVPGVVFSGRRLAL